MSDSEDEDYALYGTPLEPLDEDSIPRKKPINIEDQIVTDKYGKRRFHGAFTGGFSAGFFNTVGSLEGWKPSTFKSTRANKADIYVQKPDDFMDDEDRDEFGIAPTVLRAKPEYGGSKKNKREIGQRFSLHPIPGEPVLQTILEPIRETVGVKLLMKMGWKPGQGVGPRLTNAEKKYTKVYGCARPPGQSREEDDDTSDSEPLPGNLDLTVLFAPDDYEPFLAQPKQDSFGMGYKGLDRRQILSGNSTRDSCHINLFEPPPVCDQKTKLSISGQAFGVGAFEEEDEDIYAKDDMNQYDFALENHATLAEQRRKERMNRKCLLAICEQNGVLLGFVAAKNNKTKKKYFSPPELPHGFVPRPRRSRFDDDRPKSSSYCVEQNKTKLTASDRKAIVGDNNSIIVQKSVRDDPESLPITECSTNKGNTFRPFAEDVDKQARYERYLNFIKIGAKDAFQNIQPKSMSDWEKEKERKEFEDAARLYTPLSGFMAEKFTPGQISNEDSGENIDTVQSDLAGAAKAMMFGKLTHTITDWAPSSLLCKRFNVQPPWTTNETLSVGGVSDKKKKFKFSIFDFMEASKHNQLSELAQNNVPSCYDSTEIKQEPLTSTANDETEGVSVEANISEQSSELKKPQIMTSATVVEFEDVEDKKDLFKAIFLSSSSEDESDDDKIKNTGESNRPKEPNEKPLEQYSVIGQVPESDAAVKNVLRNTSPPRGIFANLDLDSLNSQKKDSDRCKSIETAVMSVELDPMAYGPKLPAAKLVSKPVFSSTTSLQSEHIDDEWVEKKTSDKSGHKHKKHSKKHAKEKKKDKHKRKKSKRHKD